MRCVGCSRRLCAAPNEPEGQPNIIGMLPPAPIAARYMLALISGPALPPPPHAARGRVAPAFSDGCTLPLRRKADRHFLAVVAELSEVTDVGLIAIVRAGAIEADDAVDTLAAHQLTHSPPAALALLH